LRAHDVQPIGGRGLEELGPDAGRAAARLFPPRERLQLEIVGSARERIADVLHHQQVG
jgi:hypothetical protein